MGKIVIYVFCFQVPKEQVFDTVELFHLPRQRYISLRFLAWYFLGKVYIIFPIFVTFSYFPFNGAVVYISVLRWLKDRPILCQKRQWLTLGLTGLITYNWLTYFMTLLTDWLTTFFILSGLTIQSETHDSTEDANTALQLYKKYEELTAIGEFRNVLRQVYEDGRKSGWQIGDSTTEWGQNPPLPFPITII